MKKLVLALLLIATSCCTTITSPVTQIEYTGSIDEEGIAIKAKPPFWDWLIGYKQAPGKN